MTPFRCGGVRWVNPPVPPLAQREQPGLSQTLTGPKDARHCQGCGDTHSKEAPLARWLEHDPMDRLPEKPAVVVLCKRCSDRLIDPHPRLYRHIDAGAPFPGCMSICMDCRHRDGVSCSSPTSKMNRGPGLEMRWEKAPISAHINYGGGRGEFKHIFSGPVISCSGREVTP